MRYSSLPASVASYLATRASHSVFASVSSMYTWTNPSDRLLMIHPTKRLLASSHFFCSSAVSTPLGLPSLLSQMHIAVNQMRTLDFQILKFTPVNFSGLSDSAKPAIVKSTDCL